MPRSVYRKELMPKGEEQLDAWLDPAELTWDEESRAPRRYSGRWAEGIPEQKCSGL